MRLYKPTFDLINPLTCEDGIRQLQFIERMARISHRSEDKQTYDTWNRFLSAVVLKHGDWSVVEHASATVIFRVDRGVTHELVRHRLFCLDGDSKLYFDLPAGQSKGRSRRRYAVPLFNLYKNWTEGQKINHHISGVVMTIPKKENIRKMKLRMCNEDTGEIETTHISNIISSGTKPVYKVILDNGYIGRMTLEHRVLTSEGWRQLKEVGTALVAVNGMEPHTLLNRAGNLRGMCITPDGRKKLGDAKRGSKNHCWKGGVKSWRQKVSEWIGKIAKEIHTTFNFTCQICGQKGSTKKNKLSCHHIDPVWHAPEKAFDKINLITLCMKCNRELYSKNLEIPFMEELNILPTMEFWARHQIAFPSLPIKTKTRGNRLVRSWARIVNLEYIGERPTYDVEVIGPYHNFIADGLVVHNSFTQESTRFVNGRKSYPDGLEFVVPEGLLGSKSLWNWEQAVRNSELEYLQMLDDGVRPQEARAVLPNSLAATIAVTGNLRNWRHILIMRTTQETHPDFKRVMIPLLSEFQSRIPLLFDDIIPNQKQSEAMSKPR